MPDVIAYFAFVGMFVFLHVGFSTYRGIAGKLRTQLDIFFPVIVLIGNLGIIMTYIIKVCFGAGGGEGGPSQFQFAMQQQYPMYMLSIGTMTSALLLLCSHAQSISDLVYFSIIWGYFIVSAAFGMWMVLASNIEAADIIGAVALGHFALMFPVIRYSDIGNERAMWWRFSRLTNQVQRTMFRPYDLDERVHLLVRYSVPSMLVVAWSFCQAYVSLRYFLDPARFAADVIFTGIMPVAFSALISGNLELWFHFRILCENARWLVLCSFPCFADRSFNARTNDVFFVYSSWGPTNTSTTYLASMYIIAPAALAWVVFLYFFPSRGGVSRLSCSFKRHKSVSPSPHVEVPTKPKQQQLAPPIIMPQNIRYRRGQP